MIRQQLARRGLVIVTGALLAAFAPTPLAHADEAVAAAWEVRGTVYDSFGHATGPVPYRGQSFTAKNSGPLVAVSLRIGRVGTPPPLTLMRIELRATDANGLPTSNVIAFVEVLSNILPNMVSDVVRFDFSPTIVSLEANKSYAIIAYPKPFHPSGDPYFLNGDANASATYSGGLALSSRDGVQWVSYPSVDYGFEVLVNGGVATDASSWSRVKLLY